VIKYRFKVTQSLKTSNFHLYFEDSWGARRVVEALKKLHTMNISKVTYFGGFQNSIMITPPLGVCQWEIYCARYVWPPSMDNKDKGMCFFLMDLEGNLILPEYCSRCNKEAPSITHTVLDSAMKVVSKERYCSTCSSDYSEILMGAAKDG
jgi:hypothetical protein